MKKIGEWKPNKVVIVSAIIIIVTLGIGFGFIYRPFVNKSKSLKAEIQHNNERNVLLGKIKAIDKHLKFYRKRIPEGRDVSWLLSVVSDMASDEKIELSSIEPGAPEERDLCTKLFVILNTVSTYHQLGRFISRIESSEKFLRVEHITVKRFDIDQEIDEKVTRFKAFDVKSHIVVSTMVLKE